MHFDCPNTVICHTTSADLELKEMLHIQEDAAAYRLIVKQTVSYCCILIGRTGNGGTHTGEKYFEVHPHWRKAGWSEDTSAKYACNLDLKAQLCRSTEGWVGPAISVQ